MEPKPTIKVESEVVEKLPEVPAPVVEAPVVKEPEVLVREKSVDPVSEVSKVPVYEEPVTIVEEPVVDKFSQRRVAEEPSLEELIYAYLTAGQGESPSA